MFMQKCLTNTENNVIKKKKNLPLLLAFLLIPFYLFYNRSGRTLLQFVQHT